jgi:hypothetical protein
MNRSARLQEISEMAISDPEQIQICWDKLDSDPKYKEEFEEVVLNTLGLMPMLEEMHTKMSNGESVAFQGKDTPLTAQQIDEYMDIIENELYAGYQMAYMWYKYEKVKEIVGA